VSETTLRVSCGGLCRIVDPATGRYLLGMNRNRLQRGDQILMPLGGALTYTQPPPVDFTPEVPGTTDLRLFLPENQLEPFRAWFSTRTDRETSPFRELAEELVTEYRVLDALRPSDVTLTHRFTHEQRRFTNRSGVTGLLTHSLQEIYDATFHRHGATLRDVSPDTGLYWVSADQIRARHYTESIRVQADVLLKED
jgi:hypothetical protein